MGDNILEQGGTLMKKSLESSLEGIGAKLESVAVKIIDDFERAPLTTALKAVVVAWAVQKVRASLGKSSGNQQRF